MALVKIPSRVRIWFFKPVFFQYTALYSHCCQVNSVILEFVKYRENWAVESSEMMRFLVTGRLAALFLISDYWGLG